MINNKGTNGFIGRPTTGWTVLIIVLLCFLAYSNSLTGAFVFDDKDVVVENHDIESWSNLSRAFSSHVWAFRENTGAETPPPLPYYRPIFTVMVTVEYHLFHLQPRGWRLVSLILHILCSIAVFLVLNVLSKKTDVAAMTAMLFAVYPIHSEPVSWISSMSDLLFGLFFLLSFWLYLKYRSAQETTASRHGVTTFVLSLLMYFFSTLSKEAALALPLLVLGYEFSAGDRGWARRLIQAAKSSAPFFAVTAVYLLLRYNALRDLMWKNPQAPDRPFSLTILTLPGIVARYLFHLVWPFGLGITYDTHFVTRVFSTDFLIPLAAFGVAAAALIAYKERISREIWFCLLIVFLPLLPVLNLGQISREEYLIFDRYLYLSAIGWCFLIAMGLERVFVWRQQRKPSRQTTAHSVSVQVFAHPVLIASLLLIALLTFATARENTHWADEYSLWSNAARISPNFWAVHYNTGLALLDERRFQEARDPLIRAAQLNPREPSVFDSLGVAYDGSGDSTNALLNFKRALEIDPAKFESLNNLGGLHFRAGDYAAAERLFKSALQVNPNAAAARYNLGLSFARQGRYDEAARELEAVIKSKPDDANALFDLGLTYEQLGRRDAAVRAFAQAMTLTNSDELKRNASQAIARNGGAAR